MSEINNVSGQCLCGSVKVSVNNASNEIGACHCDMCRKWSGGPFLGIDCKQEVTFTGEEFVSSYASSEWAQRGFCRKCGTHLFYKFLQANQYIMPVGLFDSQQDYVFDHQIFIDEKPNYYCFSNDTKNMTGEEVMKMFAGGS